MLKNTSLPNSVIRTITELYIICRLKDESSFGKKISEFMNVPKPGFWAIELSGISEKRKEVGNSDSIVRLICFYQKNDGYITYCTETVEGELLLWENCCFCCLLPYNFDWNTESETAVTNLEWAKNAVLRHELGKDLEEGERLFFDINERKKQ